MENYKIIKLNKTNLIFLLLLYVFNVRVCANTISSRDIYPESINENGGVSQLGAGTVNVPIDIYNDPSCASPKLSLDYNSMSSNSYLGWGWNLSCGSFITRSGHDVYHDNFTSAVSWGDYSNTFYLDGVKLILTSMKIPMIEIFHHPFLENKLYFETENGHVKAIANVESSGMIHDFEVRHPNGTVCYYTSSDKRGFYLTKSVDALGHEVAYEYSSDDKRLLNIKYGKNYCAKITFIYNNLDAKSKFISERFHHGYKTVIDKLLSSVQVSVNNNILWEYTISYQDNGNVKSIAQINCKSGMEEKKPLNFTYYNSDGTPKTFSKSEKQMQYSFPFGSSNEISAMRLNCDNGYYGDALIMYPNKNPYIHDHRHATMFRHSWDRVLNGFAEDQKITYEFPDFCGTLTAGPGFYGTMSANIDEDEADELIKINQYVEDGKDYVEVNSYKPMSTTPLGNYKTFKHSFNDALYSDGHRSILPKYFYVGDFNGDGKNELLVVTANNMFGNGIKTELYVIDLISNTVLYSATAPFDFNITLSEQNHKREELLSGEDADKKSDKLFAYDIDKDGKTDLCLINESGAHSFCFDCDGTKITSCEEFADFKELNLPAIADNQLGLGDFNGDNIIDIMVYPKSGNNDWKLYVGKGTGDFEKMNLSLGTYNSNNTYFVQDVNLDGVSDIVCKDPNGIISVSLMGNNDKIGILNTSVAKNSYLMPVNFYENNLKASLIGITSDGKLTTLKYTGNEFHNRMLWKYDNSKGVTKEFTYQTVFVDKTMNTSMNFPYVTYAGPLLLAKNLKIYKDVDVFSNKSYGYTNPILHKQGLGFRGFQKISTFDQVTDEYTYSYFDVYKTGKLQRYEDSKSITNYDYTYDIDNNKFNHSCLGETTIQNKATGVENKETYTYDNYGNVKHQHTDYGDNLSCDEDYEYLNIDNDSVYNIGLLNKYTKTINRSSGSLTTSEEYKYNEDFLVTEKKNFVNTKLVKTERYVYNTNKQKTQTQTVNFNSSIVHEHNIVYNDKDLIQVNQMEDGNNQSLTYDDKNNLVKIEDFTGISTMLYDSFGNIITTTSPNGSILSKEKHWSNGENGSVYYIIKKETGRPDVIQYFDAFDREVRSGTKRFDGMFLFVDKVYNKKGQIAMISMPFKTSPSGWILYSYDSYGRLISIKQPSGNILTYSYDGLSVTECKDGISRTTLKNVLNEPLYVMDESGGIIYHYNFDGTVASITAPGNVKTKMEYDSYGRQIKLIDPCSGTKETSYDEEGNLSSEVKLADGQNLKYTYDKYNRVVSVSKPQDGVYNYQYDAHGRLESVKKEDGSISKVFEYFPDGRLQSTSQNIVDGRGLTSVMTYKDNNLSEISYFSIASGSPEGHLLATENYIYTNGVLSEVRVNNNKTIWKLIQEDDCGNATVIETDGLKRQYKYDINSLPIERAVLKDNNILWSDTYTFDGLTGNLKMRKNRYDRIEEFAYDSQNRLMSCNGDKYTYDYQGNITKNSKFGNFEYDEKTPYAVAGETVNSASFHQSNQSIIYNFFNKPISIDENGESAFFEYDVDGNRVKMKKVKYGQTDYTKWYVGNKYEVKEDASGKLIERLYLGGDAYSAPAVLVKTNGNDSLYYIVRDYLGSIREIINEKNEIVQEVDYDPWGRLIDPKTGNSYVDGQEPELFLDRGYTGHEHLREFCLINMNGRLYDASIGRFLNPDPVVQDVSNSQNFNRYSYCLNNPLKYVDQNGQFILTTLVVVVGCIVGAYIGGSVANQSWNIAKWDFSSASTYLGISFGAILGGVGGSYIAGLGGAFSVTFSVVTPIGAIGVDLYNTDQNKTPRTNFEFGTAAGGYYNSGVAKSEKAAGVAYDNAANQMRTYNQYVAEQSCWLQSTKIFTEGIENESALFDALSKGLSTSGPVFNYDIPMTGYTTSPSLYVSDIERGSKFLGRACNLATVGIAAYQSYDIYNNKDNSEYQKWRYIGRSVGEALGSIAGGLAGSAIGSTICPGPGTYAGALILGYFGGKWGANLGENIGEYLYYKNTTFNSAIGSSNYSQQMYNNTYW